MRIFVVLNPAAGNSHPKEVRASLSRHFSGSAHELEIYETRQNDQTCDLVANAVEQGYEAVFAAGGDGTVSEVVDGLIGADVPLGIIPVGTSNALAQELALPLDVDEAVSLLRSMPPYREVDAIKVLSDRECSQHYLLNVNVGLGAVAMEETDRHAKRYFGELAYLWSTLKELVGLQPHLFQLEIDGETEKVRAAQILLANAGVLKSPLRWGQHIRPDDGQIDVCIVRARSAVDYVLLLWQFLLGRQGVDSRIRYLAGRAMIKIKTTPPLPVAGDGEPIGKTPLVTRVLPRAVKIYAPAEGKEDG